MRFIQRLICEIFGHKWKGCHCVRCGDWRDEEHQYQAMENPCEQRCSRCAYVKSEHIWEGTGCVKTCKTCGKTEGQHFWQYKGDRVVCGCGAAKHKLYRSYCENPITEYTCEICGKSGGTNDNREFGYDFLKAPCVEPNDPKT
ncbi:MAG TPA: hypothetical protein PK854_11275 [Oscillospiraceae bacterium]|nr:hypothetical protein [Oscillospiraceae bacterium]HPS35832.1 hypothetical protein [Oscillospiraceae bacterium]